MALSSNEEDFYKFDKSCFEKITIHKISIDEIIKYKYEKYRIEDERTKALWLLKAVSLIDLTTLAGDDSDSNVKRLCYKAADPLSSSKEHHLKLLNGIEIRTAAVCVYPTKVPVAAKVIKSLKLSDEVQIASVATGFPSGLYPLKSRLLEIEYAVENGATEIDVVIDRSLALKGEWERLYDELVQMRKACGAAHMKVILGVGELGTMTNIYKASMVAMQSGCHFIKTSTGKESVNATLPIGLVMCRAIKDFYDMTGVRIGFKPAGGIRTHKDAIDWLILIKTELGDQWLKRKLFRIGASGLLGDIEKWLYEYFNKCRVSANEFSFI